MYRPMPYTALYRKLDNLAQGIIFEAYRRLDAAKPQTGSTTEVHRSYKPKVAGPNPAPSTYASVKSDCGASPPTRGRGLKTHG